MSKIINPLTIFIAMVGAVFIAFFYDEGMIGDKGGDESRVAASYTDGQTNMQRLESYRAKPQPLLLSENSDYDTYCGTLDLGEGQKIGYILHIQGDNWQNNPFIWADAYLNVNKLTGKKLVGLTSIADYEFAGSTVNITKARGFGELFPKDGLILDKINNNTITLQNTDASLKVKLTKSLRKYPNTAECEAAYELRNRVNGKKLRGEY